MTRKQQKREDDEDGNLGAFIDRMPEAGAPREPDDDDDDEDDDDDDEDDDDDGDSGEGEPVPLPIAAQVPSQGPVRPAPARPSPGRPRGTRGPRSLTPEQRQSSPALRRANEFAENAHAEIDSLLASLNFSEREYEIRVERIEPEFTEVDDIPCAGQLHTYKQKVTVDDIQRRFGGGTFQIKVHGPHPTTGRPGIIKQERFKIAGFAKMPGHKVQSADKSEVSDALRTIAEVSDKNAQRIERLIEKQASSSAGGVADLVQTVIPLVERLFSENKEAQRAALELQREERKREEERRREEREREEERRREEREREREERRAEEERRREERKEEERRREEERDRKKEEERKAEEERRERLREERERAREEREREREERREERERLKQEAADAAAREQRQHERDLLAQQERMKAEQLRQDQHLQMMQTFQEHQLEMLRSKAENNGMDSVVKQLLQLKQLQGTLSGSDDEPSKMEQISEGVEMVSKSLMPMATTLIGAIRGPGAKQVNPQPQQVTATVQQTAKPIVVDLGPVKPALPQPQPQPQQTPTQPPTQPPTQQQPAQAQPQPAPEQMDTVPDVPNDFVDFQFTAPDEDMGIQGMKLVKNVDLAVQRNMSPEDIVEQILFVFEEQAPFLTQMASGFDEDSLIQFIEAQTPKSWAIRTPRGEEVVTQAFRLWREAEEYEEDGTPSGGGL